MGNLPHYPWYPDDYLSSPWVTTATLRQEAVYRRLLDYQWKYPGCQLPDNLQLLRRLMKNQTTTKELEAVLQANFTRTEVSPGVWVWRNERLYVEFSKALTKSERARESVKHRKNRPTKESNDKRTIEHVVNRTTVYPEPEPEPKAEAEEGKGKRTMPHWVTKKVIDIATEKAELAWPAFYLAVEKWAKGEARLVLEDPMSRKVFYDLGADETRRLVGVENGQGAMRGIFIEQFVLAEIAEFDSKRNKT